MSVVLRLAILSWALVLGAIACGSDAPSPNLPNPPHTDRWNIVLIVAEDLSPRFGAYGDAVAHTPNVDRLAREGMRFTRAFTTSGVCASSRAAILMGVHQNRFGAGHMRANTSRLEEVPPYSAVPPPAWKGFPELLRRAGYHTSNHAKTDYQLEPGLSGTIGGGPTTIWDDSTTGDWRARESGQAFLTQINPQMTHESRVWPTWSLRNMNAIVMAPFRIADHLAWPLETRPEDVELPPYYANTQTARADVARHYNNIALMDEMVGEVLDRLEADGLAERTVVIFTTDHGDGLPRAKRWLYDSGIHVPLIVRWPGVVAPGSVNEELVSLIDLAPTILAIGGEDVPGHFEGRVVVGPNAGPEPAFVHAARDRMDEVADAVRAVRDRRYKYMRHFHADTPFVQPSGFRDTMPMMRELSALSARGALDEVQSLWFRDTRPAEELFDLETDPDEVRDLASDPAHADVLAGLRAELDRRLDEHPDLGLLAEVELRARFYPDGDQPVTRPPVVSIVHEAGATRLVATPTTEGSSMRVRLDGGQWRLLDGVAGVESGTSIEVRAVRYGWAESESVELLVE